MALKDISVDDKVKIALDAIIGEVLGKSSADIAQKYPGVSTRTVTMLKNQALEAIRDAFAGNNQAPDAISEQEISAGIARLMGSRLSSEEEVENEDEQPEQSLEVGQIVAAIMKYNDRAAKDDQQRIYISRAIAQEFSPHSVQDADDYFKENKKAIDAHNAKHDLKRHSNRALKGLDWQSWIEV
jgi:ribosomal protein S13